MFIVIIPFPGCELLAGAFDTEIKARFWALANVSKMSYNVRRIR